jgi:hypothetical protein
MYTDNQTCADEDIYDVIPGSIVRGPFDFQNPVPGDDWAVFSVEPNPITLKYPIEQQQAYLNITQDFNLLETSILRITGHGYTDNCSICTRQRTATGPYVQQSPQTPPVINCSVSGNNGNSGSPIIDEVSGYAIGVANTAYCPAGWFNIAGASLQNNNFWKAVTTPVDQK